MNTIFPVLLLIVGQSGFAGSPIPCIEAALDVAGVCPSSVVFDLGSGDGRVCVIAAKVYGARAVGIEFDGNLAAVSRKTVERNRVSSLVEIRHEDALSSDLSTATCLFLYHQQAFLKVLRPQIERLKPGTVVVCLDYPLPWTSSKPIRTLVVDGHQHSIYAWRCGVEDSPLVQAGMRYPGVRFHEGARDTLLVGLAQDCADLLVAGGEEGYWKDGHPGWEEQFAEIRLKLNMSAAEVSAMARPGEGDDIGHEMFYDWERSSGHWRVVSTPHAKYGDAIAKDTKNIWFGVIIVADP